MKITHVAIWTEDIDAMKAFYETYFDGKAGEKYVNKHKGYTSYFIYFDGDVSLELMHRQDIPNENKLRKEYLGITHLAFSVGSKEKVEELTARLRQDAYNIIGEPRLSGDGYYESVVADPENNRIEILA
ncbi:glyoxalase [Bacteroidales bacterium]|nr:glyoxalase [Bacteroidales bacterium]